MEITQATKEKKTEKIHKHLLITFTAIGIVSFTLGALVNFYTLKRITKK